MTTPAEERLIAAALALLKTHPGQLPTELTQAALHLADERAVVWETRTWADVRWGDRVRLHGVEATVLSAVPLGWHVHPGSTRWEVIPQEYTMIAVRLDTKGIDPEQVMQFRPGDQVEIGMTALELAAVRACGWDNRLTSDVQLTSGLDEV